MFDRLFSLECPACHQRAVPRLRSWRPPAECTRCGTQVVRGPHPLADAVELLGPPFFAVSILLSFFNWSLWPTAVVLILWGGALFKIPMVPADEAAHSVPQETPEKTETGERP